MIWHDRSPKYVTDPPPLRGISRTVSLGSIRSYVGSNFGIGGPSSNDSCHGSGNRR